MLTRMARGIFVVFEGVDRCGKSTQSALLSQFLPSSELIRFPDRTSAIGQLINSYLSSTSDLSDEAIHLLFSANRWEASKSIEDKLAAGTNLICDRYAYSGIAFSSAKGMDFEWCRNCDRGLPAPDCVIFLDIPVDDAAKRGNYGEERYEKLEFQSVVRQKFLTLRESEVSSNTNTPWFVIDARKTKEEIHEEIKRVIDEVKKDCENKVPGKLWV